MHLNFRLNYLREDINTLMQHIFYNSLSMTTSKECLDVFLTYDTSGVDVDEPWKTDQDCCSQGVAISHSLGPGNARKSQHPRMLGPKVCLHPGRLAIVLTCSRSAYKQSRTIK